MKLPKIFLTGFLLLAAIGGAALNWKQHEEILHLQVLETKAVQRAQDQRSLDEAQARIQSLRAELTARANALRRTTTETPPAAPAEKTVSPTNTLSKAEVQHELQNLATLEIVTACDRGYAPLFRTLEQELSVAPAQVERLKELLIQKQQLAIAPDKAASNTTASTAIADADVRLEAEIENVLGKDGYSYYRHYQETLSQRGTVQLVARSLDYNAPPFSSIQAEQLTTLLAQFSPPAKDSPDSFSPITDEAIAAAAPLFSPEQLRALQQVQLQQQAQSKLFDWLARLQKPGGPLSDETR